jgi:antitoxin (DNA-binding transcriptional repressor) of toxin-antitoxin stability system
MKRVSITEAKNRLSALIDSVKGGSPVLIVDRGRPVARLEAVRGGSRNEDDGRLARLVRAGTVRQGRAVLPRSFFREQLPRIKRAGSVVAALIEERREGR